MKKKNYNILRVYKNNKVEFALQLTHEQAENLRITGYQTEVMDNQAGGETKWFRLDIQWYRETNTTKQGPTSSR